MLPFLVIVATHSRRSPNSFSGLTPIPCPLLVLSGVEGSPNSHGIISFTDPHPLNSVVSYRYKNIGGRGRRSDVQAFRRADVPYLPKSFTCNTYGFPRKCCKQKTYGLAKSFRCNTYKKQGGPALRHSGAQPYARSGHPHPPAPHSYPHGSLSADHGSPCHIGISPKLPTGKPSNPQTNGQRSEERRVGKECRS